MLPATIVNQNRYSAFAFSSLAGLLSSRQVDALVVTGAETDMCALATVLGAIDRGYRVVIAEDAVCSFSDAGHDALSLSGDEGPSRGTGSIKAGSSFFGRNR